MVGFVIFKIVINIFSTEMPAEVQRRYRTQTEKSLILQIRGWQLRLAALIVWLPAFANSLLEHSHAHAFTHCVWLL